jgi:hypothetical protein
MCSELQCLRAKEQYPNLSGGCERKLDEERFLLASLKSLNAQGKEVLT